VTEEIREYIKELEKKYGGRVKRALRAVEEGRVYKIKRTHSRVELWTVYGSKGRKYLVIPRICCTCRDFYLNVLVRGRRDLCYHMIAQDIAYKTGKYKVRELGTLEEFEYFLRILKDIMSKK